MKGKQIDIKKMLCPKADILQINGDQASAVILDAELDEIECTFNYDMCVHINTSELSYITLTVENLYKLIDLIEEAEEFYENHEFSDDEEIENEVEKK
jgi:hypothetical protein